MVAVEHLSFSFGERVGFINYCRRALNPAACRVPRTTLTSTLKKIYLKEKKKLERLFEKYNGRVSVCADIWTDHWKSHLYLGVTCHFMDDTWNIQKRILAFRVFDDAHPTQNILDSLELFLQSIKLKTKFLHLLLIILLTIPLLFLLYLIYANLIFVVNFFHQRCAYHVLNLCVKK